MANVLLPSWMCAGPRHNSSYAKSIDPSTSLTFVSYNLLADALTGNEAGFSSKPEDLAFENRQQMNDYMQNIPAGALIFVILAWFIATFVGGLVSCYIAKGASMMMAFFVGLLIFFGALSSLMILEHPTWFSVVAMIGIPIIVAYTGKYGRRFEQKVQL